MSKPSRSIPVLRAAAAAAAAVVIATFALPVVASTWSGANGTVRLSFAPADSLSGGPADSAACVARVAVDGPAGAVVDIYAVLEGVAALSWEQRQLRALGGFELQLVMAGDGAEEAIIEGPEFPVRAWNIASQPGQCGVGLYPEVPIRDGRAQLVHWCVRFPQTPRNIVFRLDPSGLLSCPKVEGCEAAAPAALWAGSAVAEMAGLIFGAGYIPAYLNWEGCPDLTPVGASDSWRETGLFTLE